METEKRRRRDTVTLDAILGSALPPNEGRERLLALLESAPRGRFFAIVALLERLTPGAVRVGDIGPPSKEGIRFRHDPDLSFSAGDIRSARLSEVRSIPDDALSPLRPLIEITTTFLGLTGATSPLPTYLAEEVAQEDAQQSVRRDFLDIFHHRLTSLLYRWWARYSFSREFEADLHDLWTRRMLSFVGSDAFDGAPSKHIPPWQLLRLLPLQVGTGRGARTLELALREIVGSAIPNSEVRVRQFVGGWVPIDEDERCALGRDNHRLGVDALLGKRIFDRAGRFAIRIENVDVDTYPRLQKGGDLLPLVQETVALFSRDPLEFDLELVLHEDAVPSLVLSAESGSRLGRNSWLRGRKSTQTILVEDAME
jgi:type VI secretion system protein ImpH